MQINLDLSKINKVEINSHVCIDIFFNDSYYLLIEGSFKVSFGLDIIVDSIAYSLSQYSESVFENIKLAIEGKVINKSYICEDTASLFIEFNDGYILETFFGDGDYDSWQLKKGRKLIYGSECGTIIHY